MPDLVTHATFALDASKKLTDESIRKILEKYQFIYYLGAQGPDVFYFYRLFSLHKDPEYKSFGNIMHDNQTAAFLIESIEYLKNHYSEELFSYVTGLLCHHALDRNAHPYVYYVTGKDSPKYRGNHLKLERAIDSWFLIHKWDVSVPHRLKIKNKILNYHLDKTIFSPYYNSVVNKVYDKKYGGKAFLNSAKNFKLYVKLLYDPHGLKKSFLRFVDKHFNKKSSLILETLSYYKNMDGTIDYLNLKKNSWRHPVNNDRETNASFLDLYEKGLTEVLSEIKVVNDYLENKVNKSYLQEKILNLSYSTGLECSDDYKMKYFNVIFK